MVKVLHVKITRFTQMLCIFSQVCVLDIMHFPFNLRHTKTIEILMCKNKQKPELVVELIHEKRALEL